MQKWRMLAMPVLLWPLIASAIPEGPDYPSPAWTAREAQNYAKVLEAPLEEVSNPAFVARWSTQSLLNVGSYLARDVADPSWLLASSGPLRDLLAGVTQPAELAGQLQTIVRNLQADPSYALQLPLNLPLLPLCATWGLPCSGDPFRYPSAAGVDGASFYRDVAEVEPVVFYDRACARLSGRVWRPKNARGRMPGVVIQNGSVQAPETLYWWMAQTLARAGYVVLTFDPRGQGRSDFAGPQGQLGTNVNPAVFWEGFVDAIDFFRSTPNTPYPHNQHCAGTYPTAVTSFNPFHAGIDADRLGIAGHSLGAIGASIVQGYDAPGADPWPGQLDTRNPVKVAVAWDGILAPGSSAIGGAFGGTLSLLTQLPVTSPLYDALVALIITRGMPNFAPRVPMMGQSSEYGLAPTPFLVPPPADAHRDGYKAWQAAGVPVYEFTIQGSTHYEWSILPAFPATSWCPEIVDGACRGGWGREMAEYYTLAWLDRWLKKPGETGYADADARLLDDAAYHERYSFYFRSSRDFETRDGKRAQCEDIRAGCAAPRDESSGGAFGAWLLLAAGLLRRFVAVRADRRVRLGR